MIMGRKHKKYTYEEYKKAMELLEKGYSLRETCRLLGWPEKKESLLYFWKHGKHKPPLAKWKAEPCIELAYVIGTVHGDGCVTKDESWHGYEIKLEVIDKEFAEIFSKVMSRLLNRKYHEPQWNERKKMWYVKYKSKAFVEWYKKCEEKGLQGFKPFIEYSKNTTRYYLRGLNDSDGSNYRNRQIQLSNSNIELLKYVQYLLKEYFDIVSAGPYLDREAVTTMVINGVETTAIHRYYKIQIHRKPHIQKFLREVGFSIIRRQLGLKKDEKLFVEGIGYVQPFKLVELGLFKLPFNQQSAY